MLLNIAVMTSLLLQLPQMTPYPGKHSVIVLDNARIHKNANWINMVHDAGGRVEFLPPYSPDLNPIELAFSTVKSWLKRHNDYVKANDNEHSLMLACAEISSDKAEGYFKSCMYL